MPATYEPIATTTLGSAASSITFSSIPSTYTDLRISFTVLTDATGVGSNCYLRFNSDTGTNYSYTRLLGDGASAASLAVSNNAKQMFGYNGGSQTIPRFYTADIFSYAGSTYKTTLMTQSEDTNGSGSTGVRVGLWRSTSAINTITLVQDGGNFAVGTTATIYGIKAA